MRRYWSDIVRAVSSIWTGMALTMRYMGKRVVTIQYPDAMPPVAPRFRGVHEYTIERCIACSMCARACPVDCISIKTEGKGKAAVLTGYAIDYGKCLFCGLCVEPCPTRCLHMGKLHDLSVRQRKDTVVEFAELARQGRRTPEPAWLAKGRKAKRVPAWLAKLIEYYRPKPEPITWGTVGEVDRTPQPEELSWADRKV